MPKDEKALRPPSYRSKLQQIRGVSAEEKALLQRVGNLVDVLTFQQRQNQNPRGQRRQLSPEVPTPRNIQSTSIPGGIQVTWDPVNVGEVDFYEVQISQSTTFATVDTFQVVESNISYRATPPSGFLFLRIRTVTKRGKVSEWSATEQVTLIGSTIFEIDQDFIDPENRTTVSPKPTLVGTTFELGPGTKAFVGIGAYVGPSPLTMSDDQPGFPNTDPSLRHEVSYNLHSASSPYPGYELRAGPTIGEYIDFDGFYNYTPQFYMNMACLPSSVSDFFVELDLDATFGSTIRLNVEFLRYSQGSDFYNPRYTQTGIVFNAAMSNIKF